MSRLAQEWAEEVVGYLLDGRHAYRVRRVRTADLARVGLAHLEGSEAYREIRAELAAERERQFLALGRTAEEREAASAEADTARLTRTLRALDRLESTPDGRDALLARSDAYLCAAIDAAGELIEPAPRARIEREAPSIVTHLDAQALPDGGWDAWRWSSTDEDLPRGVVSISRRPAATRHLWAQLVQILLHTETRSRVSSFRAGSAAAPDPARSGADLPHRPVVGSGVEPGAHSGGARSDADGVGAEG